MSPLMDRYRRAAEADPGALARWASGEQFRDLGTPSGKVGCVTCHRTGYPGTSRPAPWQNPCLLGHAPCPVGCGRQFPVRFDGQPRTHGHHRHVCTGPP